MCGSPGCKKLDHHEGLCTVEELADLGGSRPRRSSPTKSPFFDDASSCMPCDDGKPVAGSSTKGSVPTKKVAAPKEPKRSTKPKKKRQRVSDDSDDGDSDWKPGGSDDEEEDNENSNDDGAYVDEDDSEDDTTLLSARKRGKRPAAPASKRGVAAAASTTQQEPRRKGRGGGGGKASTSRALSSGRVVIDVDDDAMAMAVAAEVAAAADAADAAAAGEDEEEDEWCDTTNHTGTYMAEYAKTGRAKCRVCGELITLKSLRVGLEVDEKGWGIITKWQHPDCTRLPKGVTGESMVGFDALTVPDQQRIEEMLSARGPPAHLKPVDPDEEVAAAASTWTTQREPPDSLLAPMLPYQKEGLGWLCHQEDSEMRGGILADEMGMGKTLQTISLMCTHKAKNRTPADKFSECEDAQGLQLRGGGTLIIVPVIALAQWRTEVCAARPAPRTAFARALPLAPAPSPLK